MPSKIVNIWPISSSKSIGRIQFAKMIMAAEEPAANAKTSIKVIIVGAGKLYGVSDMFVC